MLSNLSLETEGSYKIASRIFEHAELGQVKAYKRRGMRALRLSIATNGQVRVSLPTWVSYAAALRYVNSKKDWVLANRPQTVIISQGCRIGKAHTIGFRTNGGLRSSGRIIGNEIRITYPQSLEVNHRHVQQIALQASVRALKQQAEKLLPARLEAIARQHGFSFSHLAVKQLKSRWGSCSSSGTITLNVFLMQLPWHLIDYVLLHELVHTKVMHHGKDFWQSMQTYLPCYQEYKKELRGHQAVLVPFQA